MSVDELPERLNDQDILIVGYTNHATEIVARAAAAGAGVVMAADGIDPALLAPAADAIIRRLERERRATVLYRAVPDEVGTSGEFPIAYFNDRRTPDLEFDHIVYASKRMRPPASSLGVTPTATESGKVWFLGRPEEGIDAPSGHAWEIGALLAKACFPELELKETPSAVQRRVRHKSVINELREKNYNATITAFEQRHSDLWVIRVRPDIGGTSHIPGQYASLGLGYWEERLDSYVDAGTDGRWNKLIGSVPLCGVIRGA